MLNKLKLLRIQTTQKKWTEYVLGKKEFKSKEEYKEYWIKHSIANSNKWLKHWKDSELSEKGYTCAPWSLFKMSCYQWKEYVWGKK